MDAGVSGWVTVVMEETGLADGLRAAVAVDPGCLPRGLLGFTLGVGAIGVLTVVLATGLVEPPLRTVVRSPSGS